MARQARDFGAFYFGGFREARFCAGELDGIDTIDFRLETPTHTERLIVELGEKPRIKAWRETLSADGILVELGLESMYTALPVLIDTVESNRYTSRFYDVLKDFYIMTRNTPTTGTHWGRIRPDALRYAG